MNYQRICEELAQVKPFAWGFAEQDVPKASAILHPPFAKIFAPLAANLVDNLNRLSYQSFEIQGLENLPDPGEGPCIFTPNHLSFLDPPLVGAIVTRYFKKNPWFMAKAKLWSKLNYRLSFALIGGVPFKRKTETEKDFLKSVNPFASLLKAGEHLVIFPEGTIPGEFEKGKGSIVRNRSDVMAETGLLPGGPLIPLLVAATGARVIPIGISGTGRASPPEVFPAKIWQKRKKKNFPIKAKIGKPLDLTPEIKKILSKNKEEFTRDYLKNLTNGKIMPAISQLIDFSLHEIPTPLPITGPTFEKIRKLEEGIYQEYFKKGLIDSLPCQETPENEVRKKVG